MPLYFIYPIYTAFLMLIVLAVVPRKQIKKLALYGITLGAVPDLIILILLDLIDVGGYINFGPFGFMGIPFFPLLAWVVFFILFFYFLPKERLWSYIYVFLAAGYSTMFSNVLENLGIFQWNYGGLVVPYIIYLSWFSFATWYFLNYIRNTNVKEKLITDNQENPSIYAFRNPAWKLNLTIKKKKIK